MTERSNDAPASLTGQNLGAYEIKELIGAGGMGEVYRAHDRTLGRDVAVKVLPSSFTHDVERVRRLQREARVVASLNHPYIAAIYGVEESLSADPGGGGVRALILELVEGRTLAERIATGRMPLAETVRVARQVADALEAAHDKGIIHRDLKPANIKIRPDGVVKVLDFGLAKAFTGASSSVDELPTVTSAGTREGLILGTAAYMSPEQARGQHVDKRTDIWAFGCVLYEMLTGRRTFEGGTLSDTLSAVLNREPDWSALPTATPSSIRRLLRRCLDKDPQHRLRDIADARLDLEADEAPREQTAGGHRSSPLKAIVATAVLLTVIVTGITIWVRQQTTIPSTPTLTPVPLTTYPGIESQASLSPDGTQVAFVWNGSRQDNFDIYVKLVGPGSPLPLTTDPADDGSPAWSPDGRWVAFVRRLPDEKATLILVPALGGPERPLGDVAVTPFVFNATLGPALAWSHDSASLIVADKPSDQPQGLFVLSIQTGERRRLTSLPPKAWTDIGPALSPDGHTLVFVRFAAFGVADLYALRVTDDLQPIGEPTKLTNENRYVDGPSWLPESARLVFSAGAFTAGPMHLFELREPTPDGSRGPPRRLDSFGPGAAGPSISRTASQRGARLVYTQLQGDAGIWRIDLAGRDEKGAPAGPKSIPFVFSTRSEYLPQYSRDGQRVVFVSHTSGTAEIWVCDKTGANPEQLTSAGWVETMTPRWSPDGSQIAFQARPDGRSNIFTISSRGGTPKPVTQDSADEWGPTWSRDGQWIYFTSNRTNRAEIWKIPASGGSAVQVTRNGGYGPSVSPDGRHIYYANGGAVWRVPIEGGGETRVLDSVSDWSHFAVTADGIYFMPRQSMPSQSAGAYTIEFFRFATRKTQKILQLEKTPFLGLSVSPDGRSILYSQWDQSGTDLMFVENVR